MPNDSSDKTRDGKRNEKLYLRESMDNVSESYSVKPGSVQP